MCLAEKHTKHVYKAIEEGNMINTKTMTCETAQTQDDNPANPNAPDQFVDAVQGPTNQAQGPTDQNQAQVPVMQNSTHTTKVLFQYTENSSGKWTICECTFHDPSNYRYTWT